MNPDEAEVEGHLYKCRFCLSSLSEKSMMISYEIERKFTDLIGIELRISGEFSNMICGTCYMKLDELHNFQRNLFEVQTRLYQHVDQIDLDFKPNISHLIEPSAEKCDPIVTKVEKSDEHDYLEHSEYMNSDDEQYNDQDSSPSFTSAPSWWKPKVCKTCGEYLETDKIYREHLRMHKYEDPDYELPTSITFKSENPESDEELSSKPFYKVKNCKWCGELLETDRIYREHLRRHRAEGKEKESSDSKLPKGQSLCPICAKVLKKGSIRVHLQTVHSPNPDGVEHFCDLCGYKSRRKRAMIYHMFNHKQHDPNKYQCRYCPETFAKTHAKRHHERRAHEEVGKKFECECGKTFNSTSGLYFHRKENHEQGVYPCPVCGETFVSKVKLRNHQDRLHEPRKICYICGKSVPPGSLFLKHMQRHGPRINCPYPGCVKNFGEKSSLTNHIQTDHQPLKNINCHLCNAAFNTPKKLRLHIRRQHESISVPCEVHGCNYTSTRRSNLVAHYKAHNDLDQEFLERIFVELKQIKMAA